VTSATVAPLRTLPNTPSAWGLQFQLGHDTSNSMSWIGLVYRLDPRWVLPGSRAIFAGSREANGWMALPVYAHRLGETDTLLTGITPPLQAGSISLVLNERASLKRTLDELAVALDSVPAASPARASADSAGNALTATREAIRALEELNLDPNQVPTDGPKQTQFFERVTRLRDAVRATNGALGNLMDLLDGAKFLCGGDTRRPCQRDTLANVVWQRSVKKDHLSYQSLLPVLTIGVSQGFFAFDKEETGNQETTAQRQVRVGLSERVGVYAEAELSWAYGAGRTAAFNAPATSAVDETAWGRQRSVAFTLVGVFPQLVGTDWYDSSYFRTGFQRGIALGVAYSSEHCFRTEADRAACPAKGTVEDTFRGGLLELRLSSTIRPRLRFGHRKLVRYDATVEGGLDVGLLLGFVLQAS
jgi:hypothetical protein